MNAQTSKLVRKYCKVYNRPYKAVKHQFAIIDASQKLKVIGLMKVALIDPPKE